MPDRKRALPIRMFTMRMTSQERLWIKSRLRMLGYKTLKGYYSSPLWRRRRSGLRKAACQRCGHDKVQNLQVHHLTYQRLGRERLEDVVTLCSYCHELAHGLGRRQGRLQATVPKHVSSKIDRGRVRKKNE